MKRISPLLCLFAVLLHLVVPFSAVYALESDNPTESANQITVTAAPDVTIGNTIEVTVIATNVVPLLSAMLIPEYDRNVFELTEFTFYSDGILTDFNGEDGVILWENPTSPNGILAAFTLKAKEGASRGTYTIDCNVTARNLNDEPVEFPVKNTYIAVTCPHSNTIDTQEEPAGCTEDGYTAGVWCSDCETFISGHDLIPQTGIHTDADGFWEHNDVNHFHTCACGTILDTVGHTSENAENMSTCQKKAVCDICGVSYGAEASHDYDKTLSQDATGHWYACQTTGCTEKDGYAPHIPDHEGGATTEYAVMCTICQYVMEERLEYKEILGDINGDSFVDITDALLLFQHSMLPDTFPIEYKGNIDFTKDGAVDIDDAMLLFKYSMLPDIFPLS